MATPIRWDNVTINSGASAAAFGRNSTDQGRAAIEGLDIFSQRMQDRVDREDTLLTNEAIGTALNGGPAVSNNRRVDAEKLQLAVERDALGNRQERGFEDDLLSSAVNRRLNTANAGIAEYNLETAPERWDYETKMKDAQLELEQARVGQDQERLKIAQRQVAELDRIQKGRQGFNAFMFGPELRDAADKEFDEAMAANPGSVNMTPEHRAGLREEARKSYRERFLQDPQNVYTVGQRFGLDALEVEKYTGAGRDSRESTVLFRQSQADIAAANAEEATKVRSAAEAVTANDTSKILWNGSNWTWGTGPKVNDAITADTLSRLNLKADDENTPGFVSAVKAKFPNATAFTAAMEQLIGKFPKGVIPDQKTYEKEIDLLVEAIKGQAEKDSKISQESYVATSTEDLVSNFIDKITSTVPPTDAEPVETGQALAADLNLSADYIAQIGVTDTDPTVARAKMDMVGDGLLAQGESIELPEDASTQIQGLFNQYQAASKVAAGGSYIPEPAFSGSIGAGGVPPVRAQTPTFEVRREKALEATKLLQSLLAQIKQEGDASIERQFQTELNAPRQ